VNGKRRLGRLRNARFLRRPRKRVTYPMPNLNLFYAPHRAHPSIAHKPASLSPTRAPP